MMPANESSTSAHTHTHIDSNSKSDSFIFCTKSRPPARPHARRRTTLIIVSENICRFMRVCVSRANRATHFDVNGDRNSFRCGTHARFVMRRSACTGPAPVAVCMRVRVLYYHQQQRAYAPACMPGVRACVGDCTRPEYRAHDLRVCVRV